MATLLKNPVVSQIYCLDRGNDASARLTASLSKIDHDLSTGISKLVFFKAALGASRLGLAEEQYEQIVKEVNAIIDNS